MFAIVSIPAGTEDAFSWCVSEFAHLDYLGPVVTAEDLEENRDEWREPDE